MSDVHNFRIEDGRLIAQINGVEQELDIRGETGPPGPPGADCTCEATVIKELTKRLQLLEAQVDILGEILHELEEIF